jgi:hypothetical protein
MLYLTHVLCSTKPRSVALLRHNLFAHRSRSMTYACVFERAKLTPHDLRELTEVALNIVNLLIEAQGCPTRVYSELPREEAQRLLDALARHATN